MISSIETAFGYVVITFILLVIALGGLTLVPTGWERIRLANAFRRTRVTDVSDIHHASHGDEVGIVGTIKPFPNATIEAPFNHDEAVYADWKLELEKKVWRATRRGARRRTRYKTIDEGTIQYPFLLTSNGEAAFVDAGQSPDHVSFLIDRHAEPELMDTSHLTNQAALSEFVSAIATGPTFERVKNSPNRRFRQTQHLLKPGDNIFIHGILRQATDALPQSNQHHKKELPDGSPETVSLTPHIGESSPWIAYAGGEDKRDDILHDATIEDRADTVLVSSNSDEMDDTNLADQMASEDNTTTTPREEAIEAVKENSVDLDEFSGKYAITPSSTYKMTISDFADWRLHWQAVVGALFIVYGLIAASTALPVLIDFLASPLLGTTVIPDPYRFYLYLGLGGVILGFFVWILKDMILGWVARYSGRGWWTRSPQV